MVQLMEWQSAVRYRRGRFVDVLGPGRHRMWRPGVRLFRLDTRPTSLELGTQEVPTADNVVVKINASLEYRIVDARRWIEASNDSGDVLYRATKSAIREIVGALEFEQVVDGARQAGLPVSLSEAAARVGAEVTDFAISDVIMPPEVRRAIAEAVTARHQAVAALEAARGQTAVLRHLANSANVLEAHPALAAQRLAETTAAAGGTVIIERPSKG